MYKKSKAYQSEHNIFMEQRKHIFLTSYQHKPETFAAI